MIPGIQEWIHKFEVGEGTRHVKLVAVILGLLALTAFYDVRNFKNFATQEAMDAAQLARNIAEGKGYTTDFIRPLSIYLIQSHGGDDGSVLKEQLPDLSNPPVYPLLLSALMKVLPFRYEIPPSARFWRHQPELLIAFFNQALFFLAVFLVFRLARRLFDEAVAWVSALILAGNHLFWRFSVSGLSTMVLVVLFLGLIWCLIEAEEKNRAEDRSNGWFIAMALAAGALVGIGGLTRYSFGWLILPVAAFFALFFGQRRGALVAASLGAFLVIMAPWLMRNYQISGTLFGTAGFAVYQGATEPLEGNRLERFLTREVDAELGRVEAESFIRKLFVNASSIIEKELPTLGGSWVTVFFLAAVLLPFRNPALNRIRLFVVMCLGVLGVAQALGKTYLSSDVPEVNSENLLVLLAPMVFVFGVGMYFILLDQVNLPFPQLRSALTVVFGLVACSPLVFALLPPKPHPVAYPPYWPPVIRGDIAEWMREDELIMSDMPWAVAWYGQRQSVWITLDAPDDTRPAITSDFFKINDSQKPIYALYLTTFTSDARFYSQILKEKRYDWGKFMVESLAKHNVPKIFPLKKAPSGFMQNGQLFLSDRVRWKEPTH
jgi:4-amino-4-deoxy-L-arabinose transferase-like glycosyltransferase